jgi:putative hydrolase of the HAD superfamily
VSGIRAVLLDLYDTLVWTEWPSLRAEVERRTGLSAGSLLEAFISTREQRSVGAFGSAEGNLAAVLRAAGYEPAPDELAELSRLVEGGLAEGIHLWDDALPVLRELRGRGTRTAIVSNCDHATRIEIERIGLPAEVDAVILSFEIGVAKPDPGIYLAALEALGVEPSEALFVDDQAYYCDGAASLGIATALIARVDAPPGKTPGAHRVLRDLRAVLELL